MSDLARTQHAAPEPSPDWGRLLAGMAGAAATAAGSVNRLVSATEAMTASGHQWRRRTHRPDPPPTRRVASERLDR